MKKETADALCQALDSLSAEYERREEYRGLAYGKRGPAIVLGDLQSLLVAVATAAKELTREEMERGTATDVDSGQFCCDVGRLDIDQDGTGSDIVVY